MRRVASETKWNTMMLGCCAVLAFAWAGLSGSVQRADAGEDGGKYEGAKACKLCHMSRKIGAQYKIWAKAKHSQAVKTLASEEAKKLAKEKNIADPQKAKECLRCHTTAFDVPAERKGRRFDQAMGVQCESCHGPGEKHIKARKAGMKSGDKKAKPGEIKVKIGVETCRKCHNKQSPSYKPFCFKERMKKIAHLRPGTKRPADYYDKLPCDCPKCKK